MRSLSGSNRNTGSDWLCMDGMTSHICRSTNHERRGPFPYRSAIERPVRYKRATFLDWFTGFLPSFFFLKKTDVFVAISRLPGRESKLIVPCCHGGFAPEIESHKNRIDLDEVAELIFHLA